MAAITFDTIMNTLQFIIFLYTFAYFIISIPGLFPVKARPHHPPTKRFAIIIPAHNEDQVISFLLDSLAKQNYPSNLYRIFVIADNCTDLTASVAAEHGATVYVRHDELHRSKGHALKWFYEQLWGYPEHFDAVAVFDADNLVDAEFLAVMNDHLLQGETMIQGYIDSKNPNDSWVSACFSLGFWVANRLQLARFRIGASTPLFGTGMCLDCEMLRAVGWTTETLTEDLEFSMKALLHGYKGSWAHQAIIYDERVANLEGCWNQQIRWQQGRFEVIRLYLKPIAKGCLRADVDMLEAALNLLSSIIVMLSGFVGAITMINTLFPQLVFLRFTPLLPVSLLAFLSVTQILAPILVLLVDRRPLHCLAWVPLYTVYMGFWFVVTVAALLGFKGRHWTHTQHSRSLTIEEVKIHSKG